MYLNLLRSQKFKPTLTFSSPNSRSVVSNRRRIYLDTISAPGVNDQVHSCIFLDGITNAGCMKLPAPGKTFFEAGSISPGSHMILLASNDTAKNLIVQDSLFFYSVDSNIQITSPADNTILEGPQIPVEIFIEHFDPSWGADICIIVDGAKNCIDRAVVAQLYAQLSKNAKENDKKGESIRFMLGNLRKGVHSVQTVLLDANNEVITISQEIKVQLQQGELDSLSQRIDAEKFFFTIQGTRAVEMVSTLTKGNCAGYPENTPYHWLCFLPYHEWGYYSKSGQDGILHTILSNLGSHPLNGGVYVDITNSGKEVSNTRFLRERYGFRGVQFDPMVHDPANAIVKEMVTKDNVNMLLKKYSVPQDFDVLSINMGSNDFYLWNMIESKPKVVVIDYNGYLAPNDLRVAAYDEKHEMDGTNYFGASLGALRKLAQTKGYTLIYADSKGTTSFFIRSDLLDVNQTPTISTEVLYRQNKLPVINRPSNDWVTLQA